MKSLTIAIISAMTLTSCSAIKEDIAQFKRSTTEVVPLTVSFDPEKAQYILQDGKANIVGNAHISNPYGEYISCAGNNVYLVPITPYSTQIYTYLFEGSQEGFASDATLRRVKFTPENPRFKKYTRVTTCNYVGEFKFTNVPEGRYYIGTSIISEMDGYNLIDGGAFAREITVPQSGTITVNID